MNKRGDLPVTLLIIGVFAVCTLALVSFLYSSYMLHKSFVGIDTLEYANSKVEKEKLDSLYLEVKENKFSPGFGENGLSLFKEKIIFSVQYNP